VPRELKKVSLPDYVVEPPDILLIEVTNSLRPVTAPLRAGEALQVQVANTLPLDELDDEVRRSFKQINGVFRIQPDGMIYFGPEYGSVPVRGLTVAEAGRSIEIHLRKILKAPQVYVRIASDQARQMPDKDCSFGYFPTKWRPWDTCCEQPQAEPTPINVAPGAPYDAQLTIPGGAMPDGLPPGSVIYENGQPVPVPVFRGDGHGTIVAPPAGSPGIESAIPVPSTGDFQLGVADPDQFPLPPIHPGNQPPVAPPPPGSGVPGSDVPGSGLPGGGVPGGVLVPGPNGIVLPPGSTPGVLVPGGPAPSGLPGTPQRVPVLPAAPLPAATPEDGSILIPDPLESTPAATVPPAPETAQFIPMQPFPMSGPVQPTSHTSRTRQHSFQEIRSDTDDAGWRVMQGYYGRQAGPVSSDRYERSLSRSRTF